ncbi:MAG: WbqC family protein [Bacteroidia bacterium]|nr:WbqC family protein [Bacteroidia bacterium]
MKILIHPTFLPSIATFVAITKAESVIFEVEDNYQKQTYRNRSHIYGANGKFALNVPVHYTQKNRLQYKDIKIANTFNWQLINWKSIESAYRTSPYFEFYEDEIKPLFFSKEDNLLDYNFKCFNTVLECLQLDLNYSKTKVYVTKPKGIIDLRYLVNVRKEKHYDFRSYIQVFANKHGFLSNLGILDLIFNEGPNALNYLTKQEFNI